MNSNLTVRAFNRGNGWQIEVTSVVGGKRRCVFGVAHNLTDRAYPDLGQALSAGAELGARMHAEDLIQTPLKLKGVKR